MRDGAVPLIERQHENERGERAEGFGQPERVVRGAAARQVRDVEGRRGRRELRQRDRSRRAQEQQHEETHRRGPPSRALGQPRERQQQPCHLPQCFVVAHPLSFPADRMRQVQRGWIELFAAADLLPASGWLVVCKRHLNRYSDRVDRCPEPDVQKEPCCEGWRARCRRLKAFAPTRLDRPACSASARPVCVLAMSPVSLMALA
ncbi:MAG: hypothetical protein AB7I52_02590 [Rhizobiaceae bacterium]